MLGHFVLGDTFGFKEPTVTPQSEHTISQTPPLNSAQFRHFGSMQHEPLPSLSSSLNSRCEAVVRLLNSHSAVELGLMWRFCRMRAVCRSSTCLEEKNEVKLYRRIRGGIVTDSGTRTAVSEVERGTLP